MIGELDRIGVDALLLQDMGVLWETRANKLWHRHLHSSTQCDARSADKVAWLHHIGFSRVVLARELSLDEIRAIHEKVPYVELEAFVHGALCVSYSGVCYASEKCFARSANRGECAQFCRMKFNLVDSDNQEIEHQRHLLSLKDLCQIDHVKELADAGVSSFKIEGRLKDVNYVKNVVAAYSQKLDEIVASSNGKYIRASMGETVYNFRPNLKKTFNRGYTNYFLNGRQPDIASFDTPKAMGEFVGKVKEIRGTHSFNVATVASFANGDGLCYMDSDGRLCGFRVNRAQGNRLFPSSMPGVRRGDVLWRNYDQAWERQMAGTTAHRTIGLEMRFEDVAEGFRLTLKREDGARESFTYPCEHQLARSPQDDGIRQVLAKTGDTVYACSHVEVALSQPWFVPRSLLTGWRREALAQAFAGKAGRDELAMPSADASAGASVAGSVSQSGAEKTLAAQSLPASSSSPATDEARPNQPHLTYQANVANHLAHRFYERNGFQVDEMAMEMLRSSSTQLSS